MDWIKVQNRAKEVVDKYKFAGIVLIIGIALLVFPSIGENAEEEDEMVISDAGANILTVEEQLSEILGFVRGAGKVQVMLSVSSGEETLYQTNDSNSVNAESSSVRKDTVTVTDSNRNESGLVRQVNPPVYLGAIIVCQGADDPAVRLAVVEAVSKVTGLGADKISVLKMK